MENSAKSCVFCERSFPGDRIVEQTANHYAIPAVGQITEGGHILVLPNAHYPCVGSMSKKKIREFETLRERVRGVIADAYGPPISFEHGILGQSVPHAHVQMMPCATDLFPRIYEDFPEVEEIDSIEQLRDLHRRKGVYLFYEDNHGKKFGFTLNSHRSYLRTVAADAINPQRRNWKALLQDTEGARMDQILIRETAEKLRALLERSV